MILYRKLALALFLILALLVGCTFSLDLDGALLGTAATLPLSAKEATKGPMTPTAPLPASTPEFDEQFLEGLTQEQWEALLDAMDALTIRVYERVSPSVVHITSRVITMDFWGGLWPSEGTGSGFVWDKQGHIVTNYHVIERAETIEVTLRDETVVEAEVVGVDPLNDLAVLRIDVEPAKLHPVTISPREEIQVGQRAIAIGNPFGLDWTLTTGVVSSVGRPLQLADNRVIYEVIQTDAAINPGNSGGPLLDGRGQLIGVNTAIRQGAENIGFAIPLSTVKRVVPELIANGRYRHPWLGISGYSVSPELAERLGLPVQRGVLIAGIFPGGPADRAGLRGGQREVILGNIRLWIGGDVLVALDGVPIPSNSALHEFLETKTRVGQEVEITFYRGDRRMTARAILQERQQ
ncbi:MAG: trypsin-like peptidase domain-containing protein [Chloroflexi bacterium]|nr:trypsin-like peptidase domain-containing protein [Chloroflexota bacterium]